MKRRYIVEVDCNLSTKDAAKILKTVINMTAEAPMKVTDVKLLLLTTLENLDATSEDIDLEDRSFTIEPSNELRR